MKRLSIWFLELGEFLYLKAHGWKRVSNRWAPPMGWDFKRPLYKSRRHAVNAQRQLTYNPAYGGRRQEREPGYQDKDGTDDVG